MTSSRFAYYGSFFRPHAFWSPVNVWLLAWLLGFGLGVLPTLSHGTRSGQSVFVANTLGHSQTPGEQAPQAQGFQTPAPKQQVRIRLFAQAKVMGERYILGEVAELESTDIDLVRQLQKIPLGRSPQPGTVIQVSSIILRRKVERMMPHAALDFQAPARVSIQRAYQRISGEEIAARTVQYVQRQAKALALNRAQAKAKRQATNKHTRKPGWGKVAYANPVGRAATRAVFRASSAEQTQPAQGRRVWEAVSIPNAANLPVGNLTWRFYTSQNQLRQTTSQVVRVRVEIVANGKRAFSTGLGIQQRQVLYVTTVRRPIAAGEVLSAKDLERLVLDTSQVSQSANDLITPQKAVGRRTLRAIQPGQYLQHAWLAGSSAPLKAGRRVTLIYRKPGVRFTSLGVTLAAGGEGAFIPVRNLQSGKVVYGIVTAGEIVRVH